MPWALAGYFLAVRRDVLGGTLCLAWAGTSAHNASVYIADAPYEALPLIGGSHDWAFLLGPQSFDVLHRATDIAAQPHSHSLSRSRSPMDDASEQSAVSASSSSRC